MCIMLQRCANMHYATGVSKSHGVTSCLPCKLPAMPPIRGGAAVCNRRLGDWSVDSIAPCISIFASTTLWILLHIALVCSILASTILWILLHLALVYWHLPVCGFYCIFMESSDQTCCPCPSLPTAAERKKGRKVFGQPVKLHRA